MEIKTTSQIVEREYNISPDRSIMDTKEFEEYSKKHKDFSNKKWVAVDEYKKEIEEIIRRFFFDNPLPLIYCDDLLSELGIKSLSTLPKAKELNSSSKKDCSTCLFEHNCGIKLDSGDNCIYYRLKRSPS